MKNLMKYFQRIVLCALMVCPLAVSCDKYDDSELREQIEMIIDKIDALEQKMNTEIKALKDLHDGTLSIQDVSVDASTGITTLTLLGSDGITRNLQLYPQKDMKSFVTYLTSAGVDYWAYIDENGSKQFFLDKKGEAIPVFAEMPEVIVRDGETYLVLGGEEYPMSGNSVFSDYELLEDQSGEIYAVTFTFGDGMSFTATVNGKAGFMFVKNAAMSSQAISDFYVASGLTARVQYEARGVVDYLLQEPDGWKIKEYKDEYMGTYFDITAPTKEQIANGADAEGILKVMAVLEGGKASMTKLQLSTSPFKEFGISLGNADIVMYNGLSKFVYGVSAASAFNEETAFNQAKTLLGGNDAGVSTYDIVNKPLAGLTTETLTPGTEYVLWAVPALYEERDDTGYYLKEGTLVHAAFTYATVKFEIGDASIRDAKLTMELKGVDSYYFKLQPKEEFDIDDVVADLNIPDKLTVMTTPLTYDASVFTLGNLKSAPSSDYVAWLVVAEAGKEYKESDVLVREFSTMDLAPGSSVKVVAGTPAAEPLDVTVPLTATGADAIYYAILKPADADSYADDAAKAQYLIDKGLYLEATSVSAKLSAFPEVSAKPNTDYTLMAVATDAQGKYGEVLTFVCKTGAIPYNSLKVEVSELKNDPEEMQLKIAVTGGEAADYLYWLGSSTGTTWTSSNFMGGKAETAQEYMFINAGTSRFTDMNRDYPIVDGVLTMTDHTPGYEYVLVIMAKDANGVYSKATVFKFTPHSRNIGKVVYKTDNKWAASNPTIEWIEESFVAASNYALGSSYSFNITVPTGFTAYVLCGTDTYLSGDYDSPADLTPEQMILKVMELADHDETRDYYDDVQHHQHGNPRYGNVVVWANESFHASCCDCEGTYTEEGTRYSQPATIYHEVNFNNGSALKVIMPNAMGSTTEVIDKVFVVCQDLEGNCYETFVKDVPFELFADAKSRN